LKLKEEALSNIDFNRIQLFGIVEEVEHYTVKSGPLNVSPGTLVEILSGDQKVKGIVEKINSKESFITLFDNYHSIKIGDKIKILSEGISINISDKLIGKVIDPFGKELLASDKITESIYSTETRNIFSSSINPLKRGDMKSIFQTGVKTIDGLLTCAEGQKMGIFAGSGVGKTTLLSMILKNSQSDIKVICLVGERGREVKELLTEHLKNDLTNTIVVVATSEESSIIRKIAAFSAMTIAEYFRDKKKKVLLLVDSITRMAIAQREIGIEAGEAPVARGFPPSVFKMLPQLLERVGILESGGCITAFFTILVDGDDTNDPIADQVRGILDGHIILDRNIAQKNIYPPIDVLSSASRVITNILNKEELTRINQVKSWMALIEENKMLQKTGMYQKGFDNDLDLAFIKEKEIINFLKQDSLSRELYMGTRALVENLTR